MREVVFQYELAATLRALGWWVAKWPDQAVSRMEAARDGKLRFTAPKPFDLVCCLPDGRFGAIECKLIRARSFRVDERMARQVACLREFHARRAWGCLALNFRFASKRPRERVNRVFLVEDFTAFEVGVGWDLTGIAALPAVNQLWRVTGGWRAGKEGIA